VHAGSHSHLHSPPAEPASARGIALATALIALFMVGELLTGLFSNSLALISDSAHMLADVSAMLFALAATVMSRRPARGALTYGFGRAEILSAQLSGALLFVLAGAILFSASERLASPPRLSAWPMLAAGLAGILVNGAAAALLARVRGVSMAAEGSYQHILMDIFAFIGTVIAAAAILVFGFRAADALASLVVALLMVRSGILLLGASGRVLMEAAPPGIDPQEVGMALARAAGVVEVHDLHIWQVASGLPVLTAHVLIAPEADPHRVRLALEELLRDRYALHHSTLQVDHALGMRLIELERAGRGPAGGKAFPAEG
jgi:cobalt-zinc-cadmium efflux system protein